eukprot:TRINITY_DN37063_c0_g1_i1.p1 TRINITY_DN37063_c0_g1~~TRINITY_DN37063_c0_g1_i1.p1  ORF type:complete len:243 (+),score=103.62 TRINITY_DN37063_c0_g1_i1:65-793(+)
MGAQQSGGNQPVGTNWKAIQKDRKALKDIDLPEIPLNKLKEVTSEIDMTVKDSVYIKHYKNEYRDALKRKKAKKQEPKPHRLYDKTLHPADDRAGKDEDRKALIKKLQEDITPVVKDDVINGFKEDGVQGDDKQLSKEADKVIFKLIHERVHDVIQDVATAIYKKYLQGNDYDISDEEDDEEELAKKEADRAERKKEAAAKRQYEADVWLAEEAGEEPPPPPADVVADAEESEDEEEEEDEE